MRTEERGGRDEEVSVRNGPPHDAAVRRPGPKARVERGDASDGVVGWTVGPQGLREHHRVRASPFRFPVRIEDGPGVH